MPPPGALTWPSSEVPTPNGMTGTRCSAQTRTISCTSSVVSGQTTASGACAGNVAGRVRMLVADRLAGLQALAEALLQDAERGGNAGLVAFHRGDRRQRHVNPSGLPAPTRLGHLPPGCPLTSDDYPPCVTPARRGRSGMPWTVKTASMGTPAILSARFPLLQLRRSCPAPFGATCHRRGKCLDQTRRLSAIRNTASTQHSRPRDDGSP